MKQQYVKPRVAMVLCGECDHPPHDVRCERLLMIEPGCSVGYCRCENVQTTPPLLTPWSEDLTEHPRDTGFIRSCSIYIAGPMKGLPREQVHAAFDSADMMLKTRNWKTYNPLTHKTLFIASGGFYNPLKHSQDEDELVRRCLSWDLGVIAVNCGAIYYLRGWEGSKGVAIERALAQYLGLTEYFQPEE
jgi:hypothetical protein